ncbi:MAG: uL15m family ribosomal protein [Minisyncoccales bacterium]
MPLKKIHKKKKTQKYRGKGMGTCGTGKRKNKKKAGHRGGRGLAGTGKRADHKKPSIINRYGNKYFGKGGFVGRSIKVDKENKINVGDIEKQLDSLVKKGIAKKQGTKYLLDLKDYKILSNGDVNSNLEINAKAASKTAIEKVESAGGKIILPEKKAEKNSKEKNNSDNSAKENAKKAQKKEKKTKESKKE